MYIEKYEIDLVLDLKLLYFCYIKCGIICAICIRLWMFVKDIVNGHDKVLKNEHKLHTNAMLRINIMWK